MELWIRSQDKKRLTKATDIRIGYLNKIGWIIEDCDELGTYKTEKRALEVLDEIQRLITDLQYMSYAVDSSSFYSYRPNVYEMPKE